MSLVNYDDDVVTDTVQATQQASVTIKQTVITRPTASASHVMKPVEAWGWEEVRDYVISSIEKIHGPFPRNFKTEGSIFKSFTNRWGAQAGPIARIAFEDFEGMWKGAPISVNRFTIGSDPYFAQPISERL